MGERILRDRLETLHLKDLDKFDRAAIVLLCIHGVSAHGVYGEIYNPVSYTHLFRRIRQMQQNCSISQIKMLGIQW